MMSNGEAAHTLADAEAINFYDHGKHDNKEFFKDIVYHAFMRGIAFNEGELSPQDIKNIIQEAIDNKPPRH